MIYCFETLICMNYFDVNLQPQLELGMLTCSLAYLYIYISYDILFAADKLRSLAH